MKVLFGTSSYLPFQPRMMLGDVNVLGLPYVVYDLLIIILAFVVWALLYCIIKFAKKIGKLLIAVIHDSEIALQWELMFLNFLFIHFLLVVS